ncbi:Kiwa anti-phage protein KwaB-like domain-containing protein, partial [Enterococcus entomosocium]
LDTNDTFGFSKNIAMVIYDDEVLIKHLPIFEKCCQMETEFKKNSAEVLNSIASFKFIDNIEELLHTAEKDTRIARRLTKMNSDPDRVKAFFTNKDRVKLVLKDPEFNDKFKGIEYNGSTLVYDSKLRQQFITLISDASYESIVGGQKRIDNSL